MTCHCGPADNLAVFGALDAATSGDIIVAATDGFVGTAVTGDLVLGMARNKGLAGFVTDGLVRDVVGIEAVGLPVYCAGITPNSPARNGPGTVGFPVVMGGVAIAPGDILVGDRDGIVVVPRLEARQCSRGCMPFEQPKKPLMHRCGKVLKCLTSLRPSSDRRSRAISTDLDTLSTNQAVSSSPQGPGSPPRSLRYATDTSRSASSSFAMASAPVVDSIGQVGETVSPHSAAWSDAA